jgi:hypothetical protein
MPRSTGVDATDALEADAQSSISNSPRKGRPKVAVTTDALFRLASLQCTQTEVATYFGCTERTIRRRLTKPEYREAWKTGRARGRISLRRLGWRHASGTGSAAVAAWIHMSKFILGYSEKLLGERSGVDLPSFDAAGAKERLMERIACLSERQGSADKLGEGGS